ncbi:hypothetical protein, partial [Klebsiella pneumoniae]|uniref:hypothetical protein n=1 Tax=Klebsiella pneumoniae TaxID=573 RepID=UPI001C707DAE
MALNDKPVFWDHPAHLGSGEGASFLNIVSEWRIADQNKCAHVPCLLTVFPTCSIPPIISRNVIAKS